MDKAEIVVSPIGSGKSHSYGIAILNTIENIELEDIKSFYSPVHNLSIARFEYFVGLEFTYGACKLPRCKHVNALS